MFRLTQKSIKKSLAKFHVSNARGDVVGSINVAPEEVETLLRQWSGPAARPRRESSPLRQ
jgi:hypothetical protein